MKTILKSIVIIILFLTASFRLHSQSLTAEEIYKKVNGSILYCTSYDKDGYIVSWGSAVLISREGIVYTCFHLFNNAEKIVLERDGKKFNDVKVIGTEPEKDILILKIVSGDYTDLKIGNSDSLKIGEQIYAYGNPECYKNTFSNGIVSAFRDNEADLGIKQIQYTASTSHGSSGGALFDSEGELIGITYQSDERGQNINFAIPINYFINVNTVDYYDSNQVKAVTAYCLGYSSYKSGGYFKANEYFNEYIDMFPQNNDAKLESGQNYLSRGQFDSALARFTDIIKIDPSNKYAYKLRADAYWYNGDTVAALDDYNTAIKLDSNYYSAWIGMGFFKHSILNRNKEALADYNKAIELKPENTFLLKWRGELYLNMGDTDKAYNDLLNSINPELDREETCYDRGLLFARMDRNTEAIYDFTSAIKLNPFNPDYYFSRGVEYSKTEDYINAASDYEQAVKLQLPGATAFNNLAYCHLNLKEYDDAEKYFKRAVLFDSYHFDSYLGLAMVSLKENEKKDCLDYLKKAIEIQPLLKKGIKGIRKLESQGYFWSREEKQMLNEIFKLAGYKYDKYKTDKSHSNRKKARARS